MSWCIGFDTSNYTTSVAAFNGIDVVSLKKILPVKSGMCGLRQSDAVFLHIRQIPDLFSELCRRIDTEDICGVGISCKPRNVEKSYMPVFTVGTSFGECISQLLNVPLYEFSHQDGHIMSAVHSADCYGILEDKFLAVHLSGGTTEILLTRYNGKNFDNEIIGGTKDISAGQFIDRVGVAMGLCFPAGKDLSRLASEASDKVSLKAFVDGCNISYSGVETKAQQLIKSGVDFSVLALSVLDSVAVSLAKALIHASRITGVNKIVFSGGVMSNDYIKSVLNTMLGSADLYYARPEFSSDNSAGIAVLTYKRKFEKI